MTFGEVVGVTFVLQLAAQLKELDPLAVGLVAQVQVCRMCVVDFQFAPQFLQVNGIRELRP